MDYDKEIDEALHEREKALTALAMAVMVCWSECPQAVQDAWQETHKASMAVLDIIRQKVRS